MIECTIPLYGVSVRFTRSRAEFGEVLDELDQDSSEAEDTSVSGLTLSMEGGNYVMGVFTKDPGVLAHECAHVALGIIENAGFDAHCGNQEPFCYLLQHLVSTLSKAK